jgi:uncharacterized protein (TIGR02145 family)
MKSIKIKLILLTLFYAEMIGLQAQTMNDIDGNIYKTVNIGNQVWMAENLKTTKFNDGSDIPIVTNDKTWNGLTTPAFCWFNNDTAINKITYGALYNWFAVNSKKLCPTGWHVPTDAEWLSLTTFLGGENIAGRKLKESGTIHWKVNNAETTNETGFTALPGGSRNLYGKWGKIRYYGTWWSTTGQSTRYAWARTTDKNSHVYRAEYYVKSGFSVRCVKDY